MQKMKTFVRTFIKSVSSPQYYAEVLRARFSFALKYFTVFHFFFALAIAIGATAVISLINFSNIADQALNNLPPDLIVRVQDGKLSINKPLPYFIVIPEQWQGHDNGLNNIVVFDSDKNVQGIADFYRYKTAVLVTEDFVYYMGSGRSDEVRVMPIGNDMKPVSLSSQEIFQAKNRFFEKPFIKNKMYLPVFGVFLVLFLTPLLTIFHLITVAVYSVIMYFVAMFLKTSLFKSRQYTYQQIVQVSLITYIPVLLLQMILSRLGTRGFGGASFFLIYAVATSVALWGAAQKTVKSSKKSSRS